MTNFQCFIENVYVIPKYPDHIYITWSVSNPSIPMDYFFDIYISDNPEKGFTKINTLPIINTMEYFIPIVLLDIKESYYFKIQLIGKLTASQEITSSIVYTLEKVSLKPISEIIRKKNLVRKLFTGILCNIKKLKQITSKCPRCIDKNTGMCIDSKCPICKGTKVIGGYSDNIENYVEIVESNIDSKPSEIGTVENNIALGTLSYPLLFKGDIVIEKNRNKRWYVNNIQREIIRTFCVDQKIELRLISPKDIEYSL